MMVVLVSSINLLQYIVGEGVGLYSFFVSIVHDEEVFLLTVFDEDDTQRYHLNGKSTKDTEEWMEKIRNARYTGI